jgi:hypothetical protein
MKQPNSSDEMTIQIRELPKTVKFPDLPWQVPSERNAFDGWLEGRPSEAERKEILERARWKRAHWQPGSKAWQRLFELHAFVGKHVRIQFWDSIMYMLDDEGPHPIKGDCVGIVTLLDDGHLQPFLLLEHTAEIKTGGMSGECYLQKRCESPYDLAPVADICEIGIEDVKQS